MNRKKKISAADFKAMDARFENGKNVARALDAKTVADMPNAGHGVKRVVTPIAQNILIQASI